MRKRGRHLILILAMFSNCANAQANNLGHPFENPAMLESKDGKVRVDLSAVP